MHVLGLLATLTINQLLVGSVYQYQTPVYYAVVPQQVPQGNYYAQWLAASTQAASAELRLGSYVDANNKLQLQLQWAQTEATVAKRQVANMQQQIDLLQAQLKAAREESTALREQLKTKPSNPIRLH